MITIINYYYYYYNYYYHNKFLITVITIIIITTSIWKFLDMHFVVKVNAEKSQRFNLSEVIFK